MLLAARLCLTLAEVYMMEAILPTAEIAVAIAQQRCTGPLPPKSYDRSFQAVLLRRTRYLLGDISSPMVRTGK